MEKKGWYWILGFGAVAGLALGAFYLGKVQNQRSGESSNTSRTPQEEKSLTNQDSSDVVVNSTRHPDFGTLKEEISGDGAEDETALSNEEKAELYDPATGAVDDLQSSYDESKY